MSQEISLEREEVGKPDANTDKHDLDTSLPGCLTPTRVRENYLPFFSDLRRFLEANQGKCKHCKVLKCLDVAVF